MSNQNKHKEHENNPFVRTTKLPKIIQRVMKDHHLATFKIHKWLKAIGCESNWIYEDLDRMMDRLTHVNDCIVCGALKNDKCRPFWYQANEMQTTCDNCLRFYDGAPCPDKEDHEPCEDFVPRHFKDTPKCIYINNKWYTSTAGKMEGED